MDITVRVIEEPGLSLSGYINSYDVTIVIRKQSKCYRNSGKTALLNKEPNTNLGNN
jgi:hypothetical protein